MLLAFLLVSLSLSAQEVRYVGNKPVDLAPLTHWLKQKKGERPLAHWKEVRLTNVAVVNAVRTRCLISVEGATKTVYLDNLPKVVIASYADAEALNKEVKVLEDYIAKERVRVRDFVANGPSEASSNTEAGQYIRQGNIAAANLATSEEKLQELKTKQKAAIRARSEVSKVLAMNTGIKYAGLEVWDHGVIR